MLCQQLRLLIDLFSIGNHRSMILLSRLIPQQCWQDIFSLSTSMKLLTINSSHLMNTYQPSKWLCSSFFRHPKRIESYFSAIGGESDDPPPDLTPEQVMNKDINRYFYYIIPLL